MRQQRLNGRQARWCYYLTPYDFVIKWRSGSTNPADAPSRRPDYRPRGEEDHNDTFELLATMGAKIARVQQIRTSYRRRVIQAHDEGPCGSDSSEGQARGKATGRGHLRIRQEVEKADARGLRIRQTAGTAGAQGNL